MAGDGREALKCTLPAMETAMVETELLSTLLARRSVSPKRLCLPGPTGEELELIVEAALRAPDHGALLPWRVIEFEPRVRGHVAQLFEDEKRRRDPLASAEDLRRAREHALHPPCVLAFVICLQPQAPVPLHEQWLSAGAALGYVLLAAHTLGYGAMVLSGDRCHDEALRASLGIAPQEVLAGFVSIGTITRERAAKPRAGVVKALSRWSVGSTESTATPT